MALMIYLPDCQVNDANIETSNIDIEANNANMETSNDIEAQPSKCVFSLLLLIHKADVSY